MPDTPHVVVMGVSGTGKSTIGQRLADLLDLPYTDGDDLHPAANIEKMAKGDPLTDGDRAPWLADVGRWLAQRPAGGVVACSALRRSYRDAIRAYAPAAVFVHLDGSADDIAQRLSGRSGHFMPPSLLASQLATLEPLVGDEAGFTIDLGRSVEAAVRTARERLGALAAENPAPGTRSGCQGAV